MYPVACLAMGLAAQGDWARPALFYGSCAVMVVLAGLRAYWTAAFDRLYGRAPDRWLAGFRGSLIASAVLWGGICALAIFDFGLAGPTFLALLASAVMGSNAIITYVPDLPLVTAYIAVSTLMPAGALLGHGSPPALWIGLAFIVYLGYLSIQGRRLHADYIQALSNADLLVQRASELEIARDEREQDYRQIFESAHDAILVFEPDSERILRANRTACEVYGFEAGQLEGVSLRSLSKEPERGRTHIVETLQRGRFHGFETTQYRRDGSEILLEVNASVLEHQGRPAILTVNRDITERRRHEEMRLEKERAEQANRAKGDFLAHMSHEIRNPVGGILGIAGLLLKSDLPAKEREFAELIHTSAEGLLQVVGDVLDLSKIEAGRLELETAVFGLRETLAGITELFVPLLRNGDVELRTEIGDDVPDRLIGDAPRLRQVLINLLGNAVKFTPHGSITLSVETGVPREDGRVELRFTLHDTGIGIPDEALEKLFRPYSQIAGSEGRLGGTGLGLVISKQLTELMGGSIELDSAPDIGTSIRFTVLVEAREEAPAGVDLDDSQVLRERWRRRFRILLAEDNELNQRITLEQLKSLGYRAEAVDNGREALEALAERSYDLIFMDCQMPELDGYETTRRIRRQHNSHRNVPIVALTACAMADDREKCLNAGMDDYVAKPFRESDIVEVLERWLGDTRPARTGSRPGPARDSASSGAELARSPRA